MTTLVSLLAERLRRIPMRCASCGTATADGEQRDCSDAPEHSWEADDEALAREALVFMREQEGALRVTVRALDDATVVHRPWWRA